MATSKNGLWVGGTALVAIVMVVAAWFLAIGPKRAEAADLRTQTEATQVANVQLEQRIEQLKAQFAELPQRQAELAAIKQAMPEDAALPALVRELDARAKSAGVTLMALSPGAAVAVPTAAQAPAAEGQAAADGAAAGEAPAGAVSAAAPAGDLLVAVPIQIQTVGGFFETAAFLRSVQAEMPRAMLVSALSITAAEVSEGEGGRPRTVNGDVDLSITGSVFVLKQVDDVAPQPVAPAGTTLN